MGCKISRGDFFFLSRVFFFLFLLYGPQVDSFFSLSLSFYLPVECQEVTKGFRPVKLGIGGVFLEKRLLQVV